MLYFSCSHFHWHGSWAASSCRRSMKGPLYICPQRRLGSRSVRPRSFFSSRTASSAPSRKSRRSSASSDVPTARPTDNAPLDMYDTTIMLRPREQWRPGMTYEKLIQQMDQKLQFPGLSNTWTMPVQNRLDMALTGIKTPVGMKIQGPTLEGIQETGARIQQILSGLPQVCSIFAERVSQGFYLNVEVNRPEAARYGLTVADVQEAVASGMGGMNVAENVEGRERYPMNVRYDRDFRDDVGALKRVLLATPSA